MTEELRLRPPLRRADIVPPDHRRAARGRGYRLDERAADVGGGHPAGHRLRQPLVLAVVGVAAAAGAAAGRRGGAGSQPVASHSPATRRAQVVVALLLQVQRMLAGCAWG